MAWFLVQGVPFEPPAQPPLGIWGPSDPRPTNPIAGWNPGTGTFPPMPPLGFWGPNDPRPTNPIAGWDPAHGTWPIPQPPLGMWGPGDPRPTNPIAGWDPGTGTFPPWIPPQIPIFVPDDPNKMIVVVYQANPNVPSGIERVVMLVDKPPAPTIPEPKITPTPA
jgi:hypothetical protein